MGERFEITIWHEGTYQVAHVLDTERIGPRGGVANASRFYRVIVKGSRVFLRREGEGAVTRTVTIRDGAPASCNCPAPSSRGCVHRRIAAALVQPVAQCQWRSSGSGERCTEAATHGGMCSRHWSYSTDRRHWVAEGAR